MYSFRLALLICIQTHRISWTSSRGFLITFGRLTCENCNTSGFLLSARENQARKSVKLGCGPRYTKPCVRKDRSKNLVKATLLLKARAVSPKPRFLRLSAARVSGPDHRFVLDAGDRCSCHPLCPIPPLRRRVFDVKLPQNAAWGL